LFNDALVMKISVIIPTLNEETAISRTLQDLTDHQSPDEIIVSDGVNPYDAFLPKYR